MGSEEELHVVWLTGASESAAVIVPQNRDRAPIAGDSPMCFHNLPIGFDEEGRPRLDPGGWRDPPRERDVSPPILDGPRQRTWDADPVTLKFRSSEPPVIRVSVRRVGESWEFSVRDNGIGIEERHVEEIFRGFHRLHPPDHFPGTGLGLAVCRKVVEGHGGRIWVESEPGHGVTFLFTLPMDPVPPDGTEEA